MSESYTFLETIYKLYQSRSYKELDTYITETLDFMHNTNKHTQIDGILYNLNFGKINARITRSIMYNCGHFADKLIMLKDFISRATDEFGKDQLL